MITCSINMASDPDDFTIFGYQLDIVIVIVIIIVIIIIIIIIINILINRLFRIYI